jgi:iron(III) transport system ATP-binding protein
VETEVGRFEGAVSDPDWHPSAGESVTLSIRPEAWKLTAEPAPVNSARGRIGESLYLGEVAQYQFNAGGHQLKIFELNPHVADRTTDHDLFASADPEDVVVLRK